MCSVYAGYALASQSCHHWALKSRVVYRSVGRAPHLTQKPAAKDVSEYNYGYSVTTWTWHLFWPKSLNQLRIDIKCHQFLLTFPNDKKWGDHTLKQNQCVWTASICGPTQHLTACGTEASSALLLGRAAFHYARRIRRTPLSPIQKSSGPGTP